MRTSISQESAVPLAGQQKRTKARIVILLLLSIGTMINYLDRTILGIVAPALSNEIHIDPAMMGIVFRLCLDLRAGANSRRNVFRSLRKQNNLRPFYLFLVSFTLLQSFSVGLKSLLLFRLGLGISEAPCFPVNSRVVGTWFPQHERARATATYTVGEYIGLAAFSPILFLILEHHGWRTLFFITGALGIAFTFVWWKFYKEPHESTTANKEELEYIGVGNKEKGNENIPFNWPDAKKLLCCRQVIGASLGQFAGNTTLVFFLTWFPTISPTSGISRGCTSVFCDLAVSLGAVGIIFGGWISDKLLKKTASVNISRKLPIISGLLLSSCIITANWVSNNTLVIVIMSIAFFGQGMVGLGWTLISDIAPKNMAGLTGGIFNFCANMASIITPLIIGLLFPDREFLLRAYLYWPDGADWRCRLYFYHWRYQTHCTEITHRSRQPSAGSVFRLRRL
jgi:ACS family D-galactonate transporter-like MFS transporter